MPTLKYHTGDIWIRDGSYLTTRALSDKEILEGLNILENIVKQRFETNPDILTKNPNIQFPHTYPIILHEAERRKLITIIEEGDL